jgi:hypothetical protein
MTALEQVSMAARWGMALLLKLTESIRGKNCSLNRPFVLSHHTGVRDISVVEVAETVSPRGY